MSKKLKAYQYDKCSTCQKVLKELTAKGIAFEKISIKDQPPTMEELEKMLSFLKAKGETFKKLFNTSGLIYREMQIADKIKDGMTEKDALKLLSKNGMLIKRPFLLSSSSGDVGSKAHLSI